MRLYAIILSLCVVILELYRFRVVLEVTIGWVGFGFGFGFGFGSSESGSDLVSRVRRVGLV
jgi:hypothetical protein